jgi:transcriptional regulator with XRE-family HTH domain
MDYGKKLYELRKQNSLSQEDVANKLSVSRQSVSLWETNQASPSMENLIGFAKLFNISLDELVGLKENEKIDKKTKLLYAFDYTEDKHIIYRRDYMYINSITHFLVFQISLFFFMFGLISFLGAPRLQLLHARIITLIVGFICIIIGILIYALYIFSNIKKKLNNQFFHIVFYLDKVLIECTNCIEKTIRYEMIDYYIDKKDYLIMYVLKGERLYVPKQNINGLNEFLSDKIEKRKRKKPFWK